MPRWDRPLNDPESPYSQRVELDELPVSRASEAPLASEWALWLYIGKLILALIVLGLLLTNVMYGAFELMHLLGG
ncbi:MAG: hypothetical protein GEU75_08610 [Dehalococcoidia bacterium]|nr:hypothetical protein [Dehalococcoidia bacterium]